MTSKRLSYEHVLVTGGAGYVGSALVPALLRSGYRVRVLDLYLYGADVLADARGSRLEEVPGDLRDPAVVARAVRDVDAVIHLACISNDPSYDLDPALGRSINYDAFRPLVQAAKSAGARRFIFASSSSVYGVREESSVTEQLSLRPLTDYSRFKALCEGILFEERQPGFSAVVVRPSTVCGFAKRLRLDVVVNLLTAQAWFEGRLRVFGGDQMRPNIPIEDMVATYLRVLEASDDLVDGEIFNAGDENRTVRELAELVRERVGARRKRAIELEIVPTNDPRSYHVSSQKLRERLNLAPGRTIAEAVDSLCDAFERGLVPDAMTGAAYYNIRTMQEKQLR